jgi:hypothetical protein
MRLPPSRPGVLQDALRRSRQADADAGVTKPDKVAAAAPVEDDEYGGRLSPVLHPDDGAGGYSPALEPLDDGDGAPPDEEMDDLERLEQQRARIVDAQKRAAAGGSLEEEKGEA